MTDLLFFQFLALDFKCLIGPNKKLIYHRSRLVQLFNPAFLKGTLSRDFWPPIFHQTTPFGPWPTGQGPNGVRIRGDIRLWNRFFCSQRCQWRRWPGWQIRIILTGFRSILWKIRIPPQPNIIPQWHCRPVLNSINDAADLSWVVSVTLRIQLHKLCTKN
jgi:hypothetical protein